MLQILGADRFAKDIELMTGRQVSKILRIFWCVVMTGFLSVCIFIMTFHWLITIVIRTNQNTLLISYGSYRVFILCDLLETRLLNIRICISGEKQDKY
jgi:hypothetical protein